MSSGEYTVEVRHFCGYLINVTIKWWYDSGTFENPPDGETEYTYGAEHFDEHITKCPKCGVDLDHDDIFQGAVEKADIGSTDRGEYHPDDELEEPEPQWDDVWEKIDPRYN
jgi:hypothetical protein